MFFLAWVLFFIGLSYWEQFDQDEQYYSFYKTALDGPMEEFVCGFPGCKIKVNKHDFVTIKFNSKEIFKFIKPGNNISKKANNDTVIFKIGAVPYMTTSYKGYNWVTRE